MNKVAGVDEVGRGCLAGPVMAAAVILPEPWSGVQLKDSKKMTARARDRAYVDLMALAQVGLGVASVAEIDAMGIGKASLVAMQRAIVLLPVQPDSVWVDGKVAPESPVPVTTYIRGDDRFACIAAASIVAKVVRDQWMTNMDAHFSEFGFAKHKGYGTKAHLLALNSFGPCRLHRRSFAPVANCL